MHPRCQLLSGHLATVVRPASSAQRAFSTSASLAIKNPLQRRKGGDLGSHLPKHVISRDRHIPDYPHGDHALFKQADRGLYGEKMIQFGNNVSRKTETKTRRKWTPNVLSKSLYSVALRKRIKLRVTANVMKTIDREGGLDEYLLKGSAQRIKELGPIGWALRWTLMQRPEVIDRLRAEAAALGIDQATIDKQWPTPAMLAQQSYAERVLAREQARAQQSEVEGVDQGMWAGEEGAEDVVDGTEATIKDALTTQEVEARKKAYGEYVSATKAARRYVERGLVDSEEEGLKLAFVRERERIDARLKLHAQFTEKAKDMFSSQDIKEIQKRFGTPNMHISQLRRIAYREHLSAQAKEAGGWKAYNEAKQEANAEKLAQIKAKIDVLGGPEALKASRKAEFAKAVAEAETASTNQALDENRRQYLESAINKADMAIKAKASGGVQEYVEMSVEQIKKASSPGLDAIFRASNKDKNAGGDAWAALVNSAKKPAESRPNA
ncbi:50S ribosomal protein L24 [Boeremia exigua]|uniref:50S ribosomal protein L24 n=1 Tax=Boeremia exigua TaxID=749465 RepID=UPI001E8E9AB3|nr:50S ribosomal protein L24 [Boeremia exigua]KAH6618943.1 50S ribosomal protein L24 [Boeremia exigua]